MPVIDKGAASPTDIPANVTSLGGIVMPYSCLTNNIKRVLKPLKVFVYVADGTTGGVLTRVSFALERSLDTVISPTASRLGA